MTTISQEVEAKKEEHKGRPYIVDVVVDGEHKQRRIVWAANPAQARLHVARVLIGVKVAGAADMASIWGKVPIEYANDPKDAPDPSPETA